MNLKKNKIENEMIAYEDLYKKVIIKEGEIQLGNENNFFVKKLLQIKLKIFKDVLNFSERFQFDRIIDIKYLDDYLSVQKQNQQQINFSAIMEQLSDFTKNSSQEKKQWLNEAVENFSQFLLIYLQNELKIAQFDNSNFKKYKNEFEEFIYKAVRRRFKIQQKTIYYEIKEQIKNHYESFKVKEENNLIISLGQLVNQSNFGKDCQSKMKNMVLNDFQNYLFEKVDFKVSQVFIVTHVNLLKQHFSILNRYHLDTKFRVQINIQANLDQAVEKIIFNYLNKKSFVNGLMNVEIFDNFASLIHQVDWNEEDEAFGVVRVLNLFCQIPYIQKYTIQTLHSESQKNLSKKYFSQAWWKENMKEQENIIVITQIYLAISNFIYKNEKLQFINYGSAERIALLKILRLLNNGQYGYLNIKVLNACEKITFRLETQIYKFLDFQMTNSESKIQTQDEVKLKLVGIIPVQSVSLQQNKDQLYKKYLEQQKLLMSIFEYPSKYQKKKQKEVLNPYLERIHKNYQYPCIPSKFYFSVISEQNKNSNIITLCVSGFLSSKQEKKVQWSNLLQQDSGTVIGLHWKSKDVKDFFPFLTNLATIALPTPNKLQKVFQTAIAVIKKNPYEGANKEAIIVGEYLGILIGEYNLFGGKQLNLICHSLGSIVIQSCIKKLDDLYPKQKKKFINKIIFMGGVADIRDLQNKQFSAVYNDGIFNFKSKKDEILKKVLGYSRIFDIPCGLNTIQTGYKQIITFDFSEIINGHTDYWEKLQQVLMQTDIYNDINHFISQ